MRRSGPCRPRVRSGYTLMEITVSLSIAMLLLAAVYSGFWALIGQSQSGHRLINRAAIARAVFTRISEDMNGQLAPLDPRLVQLPKDMFTDQEELAGGSTTTNSSTTTDSSTSSDSKTETDDPEEAAGVKPAIFNLGVKGNTDYVAIYISKVTRPKMLPGNDGGMIIQPDQKRIVYWLAKGPNGPLGFARQVQDVPTSEAMQQLPLEDPDQQNYVIAERVVGVVFEYFDAIEGVWVPEWDGMFALDNSDGKKIPVGPPLAIKVTVEIAHEIQNNAAEATVTRHTHIITLPTANGATDPEELAENITAQ